MTRCIVLALLAASGAGAQELAFEVASIRLAEPSGRAQMLDQLNAASPRQVRYVGVPMLTLVTRAFSIRSDQIINPDALRRLPVFDIVASVPEGATAAQVPEMMQRLLRERFDMRFHNEVRRKPVFVLRISKGGAKLKESGPAKVIEPGAARPAIGATDDQGFIALPPGYPGTVFRRDGSGRIFVTGQQMKLTSLLVLFETVLGRQVVDETGLTGLYDFRVMFADGRPTQNPAGLPAEPAPPVEDVIAQMGLTMEATQRDIEVMVIDSINQQPSEN